MCMAQDFTGLIGPGLSEWIMLATFGAFYAVQAVQRLPRLGAAAAL